MAKSISVQNNFVGGLKTEFTGLNFPPNACTEADNVVFDITGDITRRSGVNYETNFELQAITTGTNAVNYYRWINAGGEGNTQILVVQTGNTLWFYLTSSATPSSPVSTQLLGSSVNITTYLAPSNTQTTAMAECQFATGNGYLFVYHPDCDPFYCTYSGGVVTASVIPIQIRDFTGTVDGLQSGTNISARPSSLTGEHQYNLQNQGWTSGPSVVTRNTSSVVLQIGSVSIQVPSGLSGFSSGVQVSLIGIGFWSGGYNANFTAQATVTSYSGTTLVVNIYTTSWPGGTMSCTANGVVISTVNTSQISTWFSDVGNYPSNADIWWLFKDDTGVFNPTVTVGEISLPNSPAPQGHYILNAFIQNRSSVSSLVGLTDVDTTVRPRTGAWFQGRVWYAGVDDSTPASGDQNFYTWTENIYFSQIVTSVDQFGQCYQANDPTDENFFDLLPSDGGVIVIQGCGSIYKLFPIQNGLLVFAANGVWFITGSQGIGFSASDYTVTKISAVQSISSTSYVDVQGLPYFWNEEDIYAVMPSQQGGLTVDPLGVGNFLSFYNNIPVQSKRYVRGSYNPITYILEWVYNSSTSASLSPWQFDSAFCINTYNKAVYPYSFAQDGTNYINGLVYMNYPGTTSILEPTFKYLTTVGTNFVFSEENDTTNYVDFFSWNSVGTDYTSNFTTGYSLAGKAVSKWQPTYVMVYSRNDVYTQYTIQGIWDFAVSGNSGKYSTAQLASNFNPNFGMLKRRHKIRGHGESLQLVFESVSGQPFDIMGWSVLQDIEQGV